MDRVVWHRLWGRHWWWVLLLAPSALLLLGQQVYLALMPAEGWLDRGWDALRDRQYTYAERCLLRARAKAPCADLPRVALYDLYREEANGPPHAPRVGPIGKLPWVGSRLRAVDERWFAKRRETAGRRWAQERRWLLWDRYGLDFPGFLFLRFWKTSGQELPQLLAAIRLTYEGDPRNAWRIFARLDRRRHRGFAPIYQSDTLVLRCYATAAWQTGHVARAQQLIERHSPYLEPLLYNIRLSQPRVEAPAMVWGIYRGRLDEAAQGRAPEFARFALTPGRTGPHLLYVPFPETDSPAGPLGAGMAWWQWDGLTWRARPAEDVERLRQALGGVVVHPGDAPRPQCGDAAWSPDAEYLLLYSGYFRRSNTALLRIDGAAAVVSGHDPRDIALHQGDLWTHEPMGFDRTTPDGTVIEYRGRSVTRVGRGLADAQPLRSLRFPLDPAWRLATDRRGRLWLVEWNGESPLVLRARWDGSEFLPPSVEEQAQAAEGFVDTAGRLWLAPDLPPGFRRDAWRPAPGLMLWRSEASYAVDGKGRVWMTGRAIAARWEGGRWVGVAGRIPGMSLWFSPVIAVGDGVMMHTDCRICYLE